MSWPTVITRATAFPSPHRPGNKAIIFILLTFLISWTLAFGYIALGGHPWTNSWKLMGVCFMFVPMTCAVFTQKILCREDVLRPLGIVFRINRWLFVGWILPALVTIATVGVCLCFDAPNPDGSIRQFFLYLIKGLAIIVPLNLALTFGEEVGWRGLLLLEWAHLGFWKCAWCIGLVWGLWHAPLILHGHNFPGHPIAGIFAMMVWAMLLTPLIMYIRLRSGSVFGAAIMHASFNTTASASLLLISPGDSLFGVLGISGLLVLLAFNCGLFWFDRDVNRHIRSREPVPPPVDRDKVSVPAQNRTLQNTLT